MSPPAAHALKSLGDVIQQFKPEEKRVYAYGMSKGGVMCYRLAAVAPVAGTSAFKESTPNRPIPEIHFHATKDTFVPFERAKGKTSALRAVFDDSCPP